tara:strand:- start:88 stop:354 length:267 start_codon:yes stop_codon:yes gene_type:complete
MKIEIDQDLRNMFIKEALIEMRDELDKNFKTKPETLRGYNLHYKLTDAIEQLLNELTVGGNFKAEEELKNKKMITINELEEENVYTNT